MKKLSRIASFGCTLIGISFLLFAPTIIDVFIGALQEVFFGKHTDHLASSWIGYCGFTGLILFAIGVLCASKDF